MRFCWAVQGTPCGRLLAAALPDLVPRLRRFEELQIDDGTAALLLRIAPATIDRRLKADRAKLDPRGRSHTKPGTLLKDSIPMRTWAEEDDARLGFVEIDLVGHEGGNSQGEFCFTLDITDIATGWTETVSVRNKAQKWVFAAIREATAKFPFPVLGIDSDNGSEFINWGLFRWCEQEKLTFIRSRSGNKNNGAHVEQKNWHMVRQTVGYHRYDTPGELELLNRICELQRLLTNHFGPSRSSSPRSATARRPRGIRHTRHAIPADSGRQGHSPHRGQNQTRPGKPATEPGRHPTPDPGTRSRTAHPHDQQTSRQTQTRHARTSE